MSKHRTLSRRAVAWLCALLLLVSVLPMYALSLYNHAFYDDFGFSLLTREAWQQTGNPLSVLEAAVRNTVGIRQTWEGTYATSLLSALQPAVFGEGMYWVTTFLLLTVFLLAVWYFLKQTLRNLYGVDRDTLVTAFGVLGLVLVQFVPDAAEAFYWFNGGVAYTLLWSVMLFEAGAWLRFERLTGRLRCALWYALLAVLTVLVGGAKYSTALFAALLAACFSGWAFLTKRPKRWAYFSLFLLLLACMAFSMSAPGNGVRAKTLAGGLSAPKAVLEAVYFGLALAGHSFSLPLLAALILIVALAIPALRESGLRFAHPLWATAVSLALFCAQLAPTLYTGNYLGDGRVLNTYHYTFVLMVAELALYWTGYILRRREHGVATVEPAGEWLPWLTFDDSAAGEPTGALPAPGEPANPNTPSPGADADPVTRACPADASVGDGSMPPGGAAPEHEDPVALPVEASRMPGGALAAPVATLPRATGQPKGAMRPLENRLKAATLALVAGMLLLGCLAYRPDSAASYGPQNMAGGSALRAVLDGQAAAYDQAMDQRDAELNDPTLTDVTLSPVEGAPASFMGDALHSDNLEYVLSLYADYYHKATVRVAETEAADAP